MCVSRRGYSTFWLRFEIGGAHASGRVKRESILWRLGNSSTKSKLLLCAEKTCFFQAAQIFWQLFWVGWGFFSGIFLFCLGVGGNRADGGTGKQADV